MVKSNKQSNLKRLSRFISKINTFIALISIVIVLTISTFLLSKSFAGNANQYQIYQANLIKLQQLDADFNQAVLKSRYELFTSYDPLVYNLKQQRSLQNQLVNIPQFIKPETKQELNNILNEVDTSLKQKIDLSDRFKSRNALLKNSLRYLPLLTNQLESKFDAQAKTANLTSTQITSLRSNLNKLIRNLLIYNVAVDEKIQLEIESLNDNLLQSEIEYGLTANDFPTDLVTSHTNIILNTKPQVEELTTRLITPIKEKTHALETLLQDSYQQANLITNIYRVVTICWFLLLLALFNYLILNKLRSFSPQFTQYKYKVKRISTTLNEALAAKNNLLEINKISDITDLASCRDALGDLATGVIQVSEQIKQERVVNLQEESFAFLAAQSTLLTKNSQKLFNPKMSLQLKVIFEIILESQSCQLVEIQAEASQIQLLFRYPPKTKLSQLIKEIKTASYTYLKQEFPEITKNIASENELWSDAYLINSCDGNFLNEYKADLTLSPNSLIP